MSTEASPSHVFRLKYQENDGKKVKGNKKVFACVGGL